MPTPSSSRFVATVASLALAALPLAAQSSAPAPAAVPVAVATPALAPTLLSYVQLAPPAQLSKDVMGIARQVAPGMQTEMMPLFILGKFGYPTFPGVSGDSPVIALIYNTGASQGVVFGIQIAADSPVRGSLANLHLPYATDSATGWTFLSPDPDLLAYAQAHAADIVKSYGQPITGDLVWTFPTSDLSFVRNGLQMALQSQASAGSLPPGTGKWMDFGLQELQQLQSIQLGLDLKPDTIRLTVSAIAQPGTPIAAVFSAPAGGSVPAAQYVAADAPILAVIHEDVPSLLAYTNKLYADAQAIAGPQGKQLLAKAQSATDEYFAQTDGTGVEALAMSSPGEVQAQMLFGGNMTDPVVVQFLQTMYPDFLSALLKRLNAVNGSLLLTNVTLNLNAGTVGDLPVHEVVTSQTLNPALAHGTPVQQKTFQTLTKSGGMDQSNSMYTTAVHGYFASATSLKEISALTNAVLAGEPVPNNVGSILTLPSGEIMAGQVNLSQAIAGLLTNMNSKLGGSAGVSPATLDALRNANLPPLTMAMTTGSNQGQFQLNIPVAAVVSVVQAVQAKPAPVVQPPPAGPATGPSAAPAQPVAPPASAPAATN